MGKDIHDSIDERREWREQAIEMAADNLIPWTISAALIAAFFPLWKEYAEALSPEVLRPSISMAIENMGHAGFFLATLACFIPLALAQVLFVLGPYPSGSDK
ncbi:MULTISPECIES: hypothetical protein [Achromobacter]|uniref:hypothetical protein n=1 Tax=Achromobacter TaxID=222 RepID=UPI0023F80E11|nr:hypothetical protein [Achromobacter anxifer]MDF8363342.1 hypothetical protein [Achromobacter anxifer]